MRSLLIAVSIACGGCDLVFPLNARRPDASVAASDGAIDAVECPGFYVQEFNLPNQYRVSPDAATWIAAEADCEADGAAHLAVPVALQDLSLLLNLQSGQRVWVGIARDPGTDLDSFRTITDHPFARGTAFWATNEPSAGVNDLVVEVANSGDNFLDATSTTLTNRYVCECDLMPIVPFGF